jgi:hypothetical protein
MLFSFQNVEEVIELLNKLTSSEKLELAKRIYIGSNQFDFIDSKGNLLEELNEETDLNNFYEELSNTFIKIYNTNKKVEKYLIRKLYEPCGDFNINKMDVNKIDNFQDLDDRCAEIFEY